MNSSFPSFAATMWIPVQRARAFFGSKKTGSALGNAHEIVGDVVNNPGSLQATALPKIAYVEIAVLAGCIPAALVWSGKPNLLATVLPLLVLIPMLFGLTYGFLAGSSSAALTVIVFAVMANWQPGLLHDFPKLQAISLLIAGMAAGETRNFWALRMRRLSYLSRYHETRFQQFTAGYQLLQVSHTKLERQLADGSTSLRAALQRVKLELPALDSRAGEPLSGVAGWILEIMVEGGNLNAAALYELSASGTLRFPSAAKVGKATELSAFNPLVREALRTGTVTSIQNRDETTHPEVVAVVPLIDANKFIHGLVVVHDLPFISVHKHTFELLSVLGRHLGDVLTSRAGRLENIAQPSEFRDRLHRAIVDAHNTGFPAALAVCRVSDAQSRLALMQHCCGNTRGLDGTWCAVNRHDEPVILKLLPLTTEKGVSDYFARLLAEQAGRKMDRGSVTTYRWMLNDGHTVDQVLSMVCAACEIDSLDAAAMPPRLHVQKAAQ